MRGPWQGVTLVLLAAAAAAPAGPPLRAQEDGPAPAASVQDFAWMTGDWSGPGPDGTTAEITFMAPRGGVLPGFFRLLQDGRVLVLEAMTLVEEDEGLVMYVRHFDRALVPMEEESAIRLVLAGRDGEAFVFRNAVEGRNPVRSFLVRDGEGFTARSILAGPDGSADEIRVEYRRAKSREEARESARPRPSRGLLRGPHNRPNLLSRRDL